MLTRDLQQTVGQRALPMVNVGDDAEVAGPLRGDVGDVQGLRTPRVTAAEVSSPAEVPSPPRKDVGDV